MAFQVGPFQLAFQQSAGGAGSPAYSVILAPTDWRGQDVMDSQLMSIIEVMKADMRDLERFIGEVESAGDEYVDPFADTTRGRGRRGR